MKPCITLITLGVSDLQRSIEFYRDRLGFPVRLELDDIIFFELGDLQLALYPWDDLANDATVSAAGSGFRGVTLAHNVATCEEVDQVLNNAVECGATLIKPAQQADWGGYSGYFADPDGHLWEVACVAGS